MRPRERRFERHAVALETRTAGDELDVRGPHVCRIRDPERNRPTRLCLPELCHPAVVGIEDGRPVRRQFFDQFAFGARDSVDRIREKLDMGISDVGHYGNRRSCHLRECADFSSVIHAHLEYCNLAVVRQPQNR